MNGKPAHDQYLLEPMKNQDKVTASGLYVAGKQVDEHLKRGKVLAIGPGRMLQDGGRGEMLARALDVVTFRDGQQREITIGGETRWLVSDAALLFIEPA